VILLGKRGCDSAWKKGVHKKRVSISDWQSVRRHSFSY
jgi:hypothetical protein